MSESKSPLDRIYRLIASQASMNENEGNSLLVMMYVSIRKSLGLEVKGLNQFMEGAIKKICSDKKVNLQEYLLKIKDKFLNCELLFRH